MLSDVLIVVLAFAIGTFPTSYLAARRLKGLDIRGAGSGNVGALNAYRQLGRGVGAAVLLVDAGKGAAAVLIGQHLEVGEPVLASSALAATLGHNFNPFLGFRGGKGAATVLGISMLMLWQLTLASMLAGAAVFAWKRHSVWSMTAVFVVLNALTIATGQSVTQISLCLMLSFLIAGTHFLRQYPELLSSLRARRWRRFMTIE